MNKIFSFLLLLSLVAFSFIHHPSAIPDTHSSPDSKAVIQFDDTKAKAPWDDEKKQPLIQPYLFVFTLILAAITISLTFFSVPSNKNLIFLSPIFHQSSYLDLPPGK